jgi:HD-GYP domain-containing protein (c-di-GMP phosphodiesterase class II)
MGTSILQKPDVVLSGGFGKSTNSSRSGYLPISLACVPLPALRGINIFLRSNSENDKRAESDKKEAFTLLCSEKNPLSEQHRARLTGSGVKFIYIPMGQQAQFREQTEARLLEIAHDPNQAASVRSEIVYETSVELINEVLSEPNLGAKSARLEKVSRAVAGLALDDPKAFSHLFTASHHDFYTATHMVNVATWMVPLAFAMGHESLDELGQICMAGMLHDIGKIYIPPEILNKKGKLSDADFAAIRTHPQKGIEHLSKYPDIPALVHTVTLEHHERMDGTGYPNRIKGDQMHLISRICAVVDSFDAMTAFRPFKEKTMTVDEAVAIIVKETPQKYDPQVVEAWVGLLRSADKLDQQKERACRRAFRRFAINCPARLHVLDRMGDEWNERLGMKTVAHNISRAGVGVLSQDPVQIGERARVYLMGGGTLNKVREGIIVRNRQYNDGWYELGMQCAKMEELDLGENAATAAA